MRGAIHSDSLGARYIATLVYADTLVSSFRLRLARTKPVREELLTARVFLRGALASNYVSKRAMHGLPHRTFIMTK